MKGLILRLGCLVVLLSGCAVTTPQRSLEAPAAPQQWQNQLLALESEQQNWLVRLQDPALEQLVSQSLDNNPALQRTRARLAEGEAGAKLAGAERQPSVKASFQSGRSDRGLGPADEFSLGLNFGWELDLWRKLSDSAKAAELDRQALLNDYRAARLSLAANVTKAWFGAIEANQQLQLSQHLVKVLADRLEVLEEGYRSGLVAALDIHLARANLAAERSRLSTREQTLGSSVRQLEQLLGRYPSSQLRPLSQLPALPEPIPAGLPSELLERRYDIRAARLRVEGSWARLSRSHKDRFPSFNLTASLGSSSDQLDRLLRGDTLVWSLLGSLTQPLYDAGRFGYLGAAGVGAGTAA